MRRRFENFGRKTDNTKKIKRPVSIVSGAMDTGFFVAEGNLFPKRLTPRESEVIFHQIPGILGGQQNVHPAHFVRPVSAFL